MKTYTEEEVKKLFEELQDYFSEVDDNSWWTNRQIDEFLETKGLNS